MFTNMDNVINYEKFKDICRTCLNNCEVKCNYDAVMLDVIYKLTDFPLETIDELPQQICLQCFDKLNEIQQFMLQCKQSHSCLMICLNYYKNEQMKGGQVIIEETNEQIETYEQIEPYEQIETYEEIETNDEITTEVVVEELVTDEMVIEESNCEINEDVARITNEFNYSQKIIPNASEVSPNRRKSNRRRNPKGKYVEHSQHVKVKSSKKKGKKSNGTEHPKEYKCKICSKTYIHLRSLEIHEESHKNERRFVCEHCGKTFNREDVLIVHKRLHSSDRPFKCDQCSKSYITSSNLLTHKRVHSGDRPYKCDECAKSFICASHLAEHKRTHIVRFSFKCNQCSKSFSRLNNLKRHRQIHSGTYPDKCDLCDKTFATSSNLKRHKMAQHTFIQPEQLKVCTAVNVPTNVT